jgi:hypothetical protein
VPARPTAKVVCRGRVDAQSGGFKTSYHEVSQYSHTMTCWQKAAYGMHRGIQRSRMVRSSSRFGTAVREHRNGAQAMRRPTCRQSGFFDRNAHCCVVGHLRASGVEPIEHERASPAWKHPRSIQHERAHPARKHVRSIQHERAYPPRKHIWSIQYE